LCFMDFRNFPIHFLCFMDFRNFLYIFLVFHVYFFNLIVFTLILYLPKAFTYCIHIHTSSSKSIYLLYCKRMSSSKSIYLLHCILISSSKSIYLLYCKRMSSSKAFTYCIYNSHSIFQKYLHIVSPTNSRCVVSFLVFHGFLGISSIHFLYFMCIS
jgi:hypothetical protein